MPELKGYQAYMKSKEVNEGDAESKSEIEGADKEYNMEIAKRRPTQTLVCGKLPRAPGRSPVCAIFWDPVEDHPAAQNIEQNARATRRASHRTPTWQFRDGLSWQRNDGVA